MHSHVKQNAILDFWFGDLALNPLANSQKWFTKSPSFDAEIRERFGSWLDDAETGAFDDWAKTPIGALALVILCDQFSRQIHRGSDRAFASDAKALRTAQIAIAHGFHKKLFVMQRYFLYMPYEHSEDLNNQTQCIELFRELFNDAAGEEKTFVASGLDYAIRHHDIIKAYGRFPHRNETLGRESTAREIQFLKQPGSYF